MSQQLLPPDSQIHRKRFHPQPQGSDAPLQTALPEKHDELIVEADECDSAVAAKILQEEMESAFNMSVPLVADVNIGKTWLEAKG